MNNRPPLLGTDGPVVIIDARSAFILRDAWRKWVAEHRAHGGAGNVLAVDPVLQALEQAAAYWAQRMVETSPSDNGRADIPRHPNPPQLETQQLLDTNQAAELLGTSTRQVRRMAATEELPARRLAGAWTFQPNNIHQHITRRKQETA
jgi:hypothetical protein